MSEQWLSPREPVWLLRNGTFHKAVVESINGEAVICLNQQGNYIQGKRATIFQRNPVYSDFNSECTDLMNNEIINQPQVLKTLRLRLLNFRIYTFVENSIISVNPYHSLHMLYADELKEFYCLSLIDSDHSLQDYQPHIYSITALMLNHVRKYRRGQAVIISGQSGAGKTQANKECLRFLQYYFHRSGLAFDKKIDSILSLSNPILEAFGNSKTIRNNNSSRFGKFLSISVNGRLEVRRVKIFNYLLEKSRIISRAENQQNFHIFYQLLRGLTKTEKQSYYLCSSDREYKMEDFVYLQSKTQLKYESHTDISFEKVKVSLSTLEKPDAFDFVCRVLSAILLLGNLQLYQSEKEDCCRISNQSVFDQICSLLMIKKNALNSALSCYQIKIGSDLLTKYFNGREVQELINSLAKILYQRLFQWIINEINAISQYQGKEELMTLGFLDIYGFEILESNSLEQLLINYTNERLHQIYLTKIFKEEEELFKAEGLANMFKTIPYEDNMAVLQLIDFQQLSIFNLLDEWCSVASPEDSSFITKLRHKHKKHAKFPTHNFNLPSTMFLIRHSPKDIQYTVLGFRDKNKDLVRDEIKVALRSSQIQHLRLLFTDSSQSLEAGNKTNHKMRKFLSSKFRHEINSLVTELLGKSDLHFIRCVKSNSLKKPLMLEDEVAYNQICYLGILDTIRLKKIGYCIKHSYEAIDIRFKWLVRFYYTLQAFPKEIAQSLKQFLPRFNEEEMLFGKTKVLFRDYAYAALLKKYRFYLENMNKNCSKVQRTITFFVFRAKLSKTKKFCKTIRQYMKTFFMQKRYRSNMRNLVEIQRLMKLKLQLLRQQKRQKNISIIQAYIKKQICRRRKLKVFNALKKIISLFRRHKLRKSIQKWSLINKMKNLIIQKAWKRVVISHKKNLQAYFLSFLTQIKGKGLISQASHNTKKKYEQRSVNVIKNYLLSFVLSNSYFKYMKTLKHVQRFFRTFIYREKFLKLRKAAIIIQRAYRQYYFNKNTAKQLFQINFGQQKLSLQSQNQDIRSFLYQNSMQNTLRILFCKFLDKFKQKCSLFHIIIDFQALINLDLCYPDNSWLQNYFQVVKQSLQKENPIQSIQVGESFTVAATTNKLYIWGINSQYQSFQHIIMIKPQSQQRIDKIEVRDNKLKIYYEEKKEKLVEKGCSTIKKHLHIQNGKLFQTKASIMRLIKSPQISQRVVQIGCGASHTIIRTSLKKVYTFGIGKHGQLGQGNIFSVQQPKLLQFADIKNYYPLQVSASFNCSLILLSNRKIYWCGTNGTIDRVKSPVSFDLSTRFQQFGKGLFAPLRVKVSWSRSLSVIGVTLISFNGKLSNNVGLRNKVYELIVNKWQESDFDSINPPFNPSFSDYLEECHVKMPKSKQTIEPESKRAFKKLEQKVNSMQTDKFNDISFADHNFK